MKVSFEKISAIALDEVSKNKYIYLSQMTGLIGTILANSGVPKTNPIHEDCFVAIKNAIADEFYGGMEPEFETEEKFKEWESINSEHYFYITEEDTKKNQELRFFRSPYKDKKVPFLVYVK